MCLKRSFPRLTDFPTSTHHVYVLPISGVGGTVGVGPSPYTSHNSGTAGPGGTPDHPERRLRRQRNGQEKLHHQVYRGYQEGELSNCQVFTCSHAEAF